ncbi:hypothetical protein D3C76_975860 [compost metagenome]
METTAQRPVIAQQVFESQLRHVVVVVQLANVFFAEEGVARCGADLIRIASHAAIQRVVIAHEIAFENHLGVVGGLPGKHRRHTVTFGLDMIAESITALSHHVQAIGQAAFFIQRAGGVQGATLHSLVIELATERDHGHGQRLFGDDVERTTRIAAAVKRGRRPSQHFEPLDGVRIRHVRITTVDREAVAVELAGGKTTHRESGQPLAAEVVGPPHSAGVIERVLQAGSTDVLHNVFRHHSDGLRCFVDRGVGTRGAGRTGRTIPLDRPLGLLIEYAVDIDRL